MAYPLLVFTFLYNIPICTKAFLDILISKLVGKNDNYWDKTAHSGNGNCYIASLLKTEKVRMVPNPTPDSVITLFLGVLTFIVIMLLPAIIELKKPKDPAVLYDLDMRINYIIDEYGEEPKLNRSILKELSAILAILPSLEP